MHGIIGCILSLLILFPFKHSAADQLQLTTFYPAPFGAYDRMRLVPRNSLPDADCDAQEKVGVIYYDDGKNQKPEGLYACQKLDQNRFGWVFISKPFSSKESPVVQQNVVCLKSDKSFGVCLNNPSADGTCACQ
jgi:hypothetical protein